MLLNLTVHGPNATHLGYLLGKHPDRYQTKELNFGMAHVFFPLVHPQSCTATLLLDIDTTQEMRHSRRDHFGRNANIKAGLDQYVNDRAYVSSSLFSTAIARVFSSALNGTCKNKPELVQHHWDIDIELSAVRVQGEADLINRLFSPLGYQCTYQETLLDERFADWGNSPYYHLQLKTKNTVQEVLQHLYILLPIFDNQKHYHFKEEEIKKLLSKASHWLESHPEKSFITKRYFGYKNSYQKTALAAVELKTIDQKGDVAIEAQSPPSTETLTLHQVRHEQVTQFLLAQEVKTVLDLGCSSGKLLQRLQKEPEFTQLTGADVSSEALRIAARRLYLDQRSKQIPDPRTKLIQAALTYEDERFLGYDAALLIEVIEHLDPERLPALEQVLFAVAKPKLVVVTTPNFSYNVLYPGLAAGSFRHADHRFEWDRDTFRNWAEQISQQHNYRFELSGIGEEHPQYGTPSQMALFFRN